MEEDLKCVVCSKESGRDMIIAGKDREKHAKFHEERIRSAAGNGAVGVTETEE